MKRYGKGTGRRGGGEWGVGGGGETRQEMSRKKRDIEEKQTGEKERWRGGTGGMRGGGEEKV